MCKNIIIKGLVYDERALVEMFVEHYLSDDYIQDIVEDNEVVGFVIVRVPSYRLVRLLEFLYHLHHVVGMDDASMVVEDSVKFLDSNIFHQAAIDWKAETIEYYTDKRYNRKIRVLGNNRAEFTHLGKKYHVSEPYYKERV